MIPIYLNSKGEPHNTFRTFYERFIEICLDHKANDRALLFAFILYDFTNEQIAKILKDEDYWRSLDKLSGQYLTVFSFHYAKSAKQSNKPTSENILYRLEDISVDDDPAVATEGILDEYFGGVDVKFPAIMFFQVDRDKVIGHSIIQLSQESIEGSFLEIKKYIAKSIEVLKRITSENKGNAREIFSLVQSEMEGVRSIIVLKNTANKASSLAKFIKLMVRPF